MNKSFKSLLFGAVSAALFLGSSVSPASASATLYSLGGATVTGSFSANTVITAAPNQWSLTDGGAAEPTTNTYDWIVCTMAQTTSTTNPANVPCIGTNNYQKILTNGSVGAFDALGALNGPSLTVTQNLIDALSTKYLMVVVNGRATSSSARGSVFMQTCGPISSGSTCSVSFGTTAGGTSAGGSTTGGSTTSLPAQSLVKAIPTKAKAGKSITIAALTKSKVAIKVKVAGKGCKVAPVKDKKKKIVSYKITMGKKGVTCTVTVTAPATSKVAALKSVTKIKVS